VGRENLYVSESSSDAFTIIPNLYSSYKLVDVSNRQIGLEKYLKRDILSKNDEDYQI
jgi:hypothetical protein